MGVLHKWERFGIVGLHGGNAFSTSTPDLLSMRIAPHLPVGLVLGLLFLAGACSNAQQTMEPPVVIPEDFRVVFGKGGGFAGLWEGFTVDANGQVLKWMGRYAEDKAQPAGSLGTAQVAELWAHLEAHRFFALQADTRGNMTGVIEATAHADTHRVFWKPVPPSAKVDLAPLDSLYLLLRRTVESALADPNVKAPDPEQ